MQCGCVGLQPRSRTGLAAGAVLLVLGLASSPARGEREPRSASEPGAAYDPRALVLVPPLMAPEWIGDSEPRALTIDLLVKHGGSAPHARRISFDFTASFLRIAVNGGDYRRSLVPFLGTSMAAIGGFRLHF
jgi:hypothetical protein